MGSKSIEKQLTEYGAQLVRLVDQAIEIIQEDRDVAQSSFEDVNGHITDIYDRAIIRRYDRWLKAARAQLGKGESRCGK